MNVAIDEKKDYYVAKLGLSLIFLFAIMAFMMYKIQQGSENSETKPNFAVPVLTNNPIYIVKSYSTALTFSKNGLSSDTYIEKLDSFKKFLSAMGYKSSYIDEDKIGLLDKKSILFLLDAVSLSDSAKDGIKLFTKNGGSLFFNFNTGFSDGDGKYIGDQFVNDITSLKLSKKGFVKFEDGIFMTKKLLTPMSSSYQMGELLYLVIYDNIPIYDNPNRLKPDLMALAYNQSSPPRGKDNIEKLTFSESGIGWSGYYGYGRWIYLNFPSYSFYETEGKSSEFAKLLNGMIDYLSSDIIVEKFPYIDEESAIFISEDTEYRFENFEKFSDLSLKYQIPVTAFIVANLAENPQYKDLMAKVAKNPYLEFASHSTSHKKIVGESEEFIKNETVGSKNIIDRYAPTPIVGFRPPREELNDMMKKYLQEGGYKFILPKTQQYLYPKFDEKYRNIMMIPRHGTDDYGYLVNLDWDQKTIIDQMKEEANFITYLNGIYTLSMHTHLFAYDTNINIVDRFFQYIKKNPQLKPLSGAQIYNKVTEAMGIDISSTVQSNRLVISVKNSNSKIVKNLSLRIFKNPLDKIEKLESNMENITLKINKQSDQEVDINIKTLQPNSEILLFVNYKREKR